MTRLPLGILFILEPKVERGSFADFTLGPSLAGRGGAGYARAGHALSGRVQVPPPT